MLSWSGSNNIVSCDRTVVFFSSCTLDLSASRPSEHPSVRGGGNVKTFRWNHRLQKQNPMVVTLGQQYNTGEKPSVILYT